MVTSRPSSTVSFITKDPSDYLRDGDNAYLGLKFGYRGEDNGLFAGAAISQDVRGGMDPTEATVSEVGGAVAATGADLGAAALTGAIAGSEVPVVGTVVGAVAGVAVGYFAPKLIRMLW